jgi:hypothetical protein
MRTVIVKGKTMRKTLLVILGIAMLLALSFRAPIPTSAQGSVGDYRKLSDADRALFVAGYLSEFAVAAQLTTPGQAARLQECFGQWTSSQVHTIFESWLIRHPSESKNPQHTVRIALFSALAEACGWKTQ